MTARLSGVLFAVIYRSTVGTPTVRMRHHPSLLMCYDKLGERDSATSQALHHLVRFHVRSPLRALYIPSVFLLNHWNRDWRSLRLPLNIHYYFHLLFDRSHLYYVAITSNPYKNTSPLVLTFVRLSDEAALEAVRLSEPQLLSQHSRCAAMYYIRLPSTTRS